MNWLWIVSWSFALHVLSGPVLQDGRVEFTAVLVQDTPIVRPIDDVFRECHQAWVQALQGELVDLEIGLDAGPVGTSTLDFAAEASRLARLGSPLALSWLLANPQPVTIRSVSMVDAVTGRPLPTVLTWSQALSLGLAPDSGVPLASVWARVAHAPMAERAAARAVIERYLLDAAQDGRDDRLAQWARLALMSAGNGPEWAQAIDQATRLVDGTPLPHWAQIVAKRCATWPWSSVQVSGRPIGDMLIGGRIDGAHQATSASAEWRLELDAAWGEQTIGTKRVVVFWDALAPESQALIDTLNHAASRADVDVRAVYARGDAQRGRRLEQGACWAALQTDDLATKWGVTQWPQIFVIGARGDLLGATCDPEKLQAWL